MVARIPKRGLRDFDWLLALLAVGIVGFGTIQIRNAQPTENYWVKQLIGLGIGIVVMLLIAFNDYRKLINIAPAFYVFGLLLLIVVLIPHVGLKINGQRAWIKVPGIGQFQPSEFVKVTTAMMLARYFGKHRTGALTLKEVAGGGLILALPIFLILLEPDVGSVLTYLPILAVVLFLSAIRMRYVVSALVLGVVLLPVTYWIGVKTHAIKNYQQERINVILDPENADRRGFGYNTWQSILTVGEGGLLGADTSDGGRGKSGGAAGGIGGTGGGSGGSGGGGAAYSQSSLKFLPEPHTDFIFAVTAGNSGFVGCILVLLAYVVLLSRLIAGAKRAPDRMGMLVISIPLPLMSAGLASLIATFIAIGFAISVQLRRFVN
jgi:rod shape determining protein RodA